MSVLEEILREEYDRSMRLSVLIEEELASLPKGSVRVRSIKGHEYYYLNYREGEKVRSDYISQSEVDDVRQKIERRKQLKTALKEQEQMRKQIKRVLGKKVDISA